MKDAAELFAAQDGLATIAQLAEAGISRDLVRVRLGTGEWERFDRELIGIAGTPVTWRRQVRVALLSTGPTAAVSHVTAGRLHGFDGLSDEQQIHVTIAGSTHHNTLLGHRVHRSTLLTTEACVTIDGMLVVSKPIALLQVAALRGRDATRQALDSVLRAGGSEEWIRRTVTSWRHPGVKGPQLVLDLLAETEGRLPRSWFQRLARRTLASTGVAFVDEHPVVDPSTGKTIAELDLACPELMIGVECQSWRWHSTPTARAANARRKRRLERLGWHIVELWWADLSRPNEVLLDVAHAVETRRPRP